MGPKTTELLALLDQAATVLRSTNATGWASWIEADAQNIRNCDYRGVGHFLDAFRGDASINVLATDPAYHRLSSLLARAYVLAKDVRRAAHLDPLEMLKYRVAGYEKGMFTALEIASFASNYIEPENASEFLAALPHAALKFLPVKFGGSIDESLRD